MEIDVATEVAEMLREEPVLTPLGLARKLARKFGISEEEAATAISSLGSEDQPKSKKKKKSSD